MCKYDCINSEACIPAIKLIQNEIDLNEKYGVEYYKRKGEYYLYESALKKREQLNLQKEMLIKRYNSERLPEFHYQE